MCHIHLSFANVLPVHGTEITKPLTETPIVQHADDKFQNVQIRLLAAATQVKMFCQMAVFSQCG